MGQSRPLFLFIVVFSTGHNSNGELVIQTLGRMIEGADESTELGTSLKSFLLANIFSQWIECPTLLVAADIQNGLSKKLHKK